MNSDKLATHGRHANDSWAKAESRLSPEVWPSITPRFTIHPGARIFTMGSCFARNIEESLSALGFDVPMMSFTGPERELMKFPGARDLLNKYTPPTIYQAVKTTAEYIDNGLPEAANHIGYYPTDDGQAIDLTYGGYIKVSRERYNERLAAVHAVMKTMFSSDFVVFTLGQIETFVDTERDYHLQHLPHTIGSSEVKSPRWKFVELDYEESLWYAKQSIELIRARNPNTRFLVTTSPVPLNVTFSGDDVITASMAAKSILRAVCQKLIRTYDFVDYFPSYETAILTKSWDAVWYPDKRHVRPAFVSRIVNHLCQSFMPSVAPATE